MNIYIKREKDRQIYICRQINKIIDKQRDKGEIEKIVQFQLNSSS